MNIDLEGLLLQPASPEELEIGRAVRERLLYEDISADWRGETLRIQALMYLNPLRIDFAARDSSPTSVFVGPQVPITSQLVASEVFWTRTLQQAREGLTDFVSNA